VNAAQMLIDTVERFGEYTSVYFEGKSYTNVEHMNYACRIASVLQDHGVKAGEQVLVMMPNCPDVTAAFHGIWRLGAVIVPVTPQLGVVEVRYMLEHSDAKVAVTVPKIAPVIEEASAGIAGFDHLLVIGETDVEGAENIVPQVEAAAPFEGLVDRDEDDMAMLLYTSGTTGKPKGVMLTHNNLMTNVKATADMDRTIKPKTVGLIVLPMSHSFGVLSMNLGALYGLCWVVLSRFDTQKVFEAIDKYKVQLMPVVPTMLSYMVNFPDRDKYDMSSIESFRSGASALPNEVREECERVFDCRVTDGYGMSECSPSVTGYSVEDEFRPGSAGRPINDVSVCIMDHNDNVLPPGKHGEICVQGPNVMKGYWKNEEATRTMHRGGWLHSGDVGYLDEDGYLYITGRVKDLIIKGGENIAPKEIEEAIYEHPAVAEAAVVGVPDVTYGENIWAVIATRPGQTVTEDEIKAHAAKYITKFKIPARVIFKSDLPKNEVGKIMKKELREEIAKLASEEAS